MRFTFDKEWLQKNAERDDGLEIAAGFDQAARRRVLQCTIQDIRERNADADPDEIQGIVDEAVSEVRAERRAHKKTDRA